MKGLDPELRAIREAIFVVLLDSALVLTADELRRELEVGADAAEADRFDRALRELWRFGLVNREGSCFWASRAARAFQEMDVG